MGSAVFPIQCKKKRKKKYFDDEENAAFRPSASRWKCLRLRQNWMAFSVFENLLFKVSSNHIQLNNDTDIWISTVTLYHPACLCRILGSFSCGLRKPINLELLAPSSVWEISTPRMSVTSVYSLIFACQANSSPRGSSTISFKFTLLD